MPPIRRALPLVLLLSGCGALSAVSDATARMDAYTLSPAAFSSSQAGGSRHLVVELPTSAGALATDRILIKPIPYQAEYLPDGRWSEPAPALLQTLLVASFQNAGGFRLVGRDGAGLMPDYTLMTELQEFQAEPAGPTPAGPTSAGPTPAGPTPAGLAIKVGVMMTVIRESDRRIVASRRFSATAVVPSNDTLSIVGGFERAVKTVLGEAVTWTSAQAG